MSILEKFFPKVEKEREIVNCASGEELLRIGEKRPDVQAVLEVLTGAGKELDEGIELFGGVRDDVVTENLIYDNAIKALAELGVMVDRSVLESL